MATVSSGSPSERFGFIEKHREALGVKYLCSWLEVSRSGFYSWRHRPLSKRVIDDADLFFKIKEIFDKNHQTYGSPRVFHALKRSGILTSEKRVARLMQENGLRARALKTYSKPAKVKFFYKEIKNNRKNISKPDAINQQWSGDITYLKVGSRWYYLAVVLDLFSRRVIGWAFGQSKSTVLTLLVLQIDKHSMLLFIN